MDGLLSQEEINALFSSSMDDDVETASHSDLLSPEEKDAIGEISNISMGTSATTLSELVNKQKVDISTPKVSVITWDELVNSYDRPCIFIQIYYKEGLDGNNILILKEKDVKVIADLMMGGDGTNTEGELSELHLSAISEAMNQMMGSSSTSLSSMLETKVDISPPNASKVDLNTANAGNIAPFLQGEFVKVSFKMQIGSLVDSELMQLYPIEFAQSLYRKFVNSAEEQVAAATPAPAPQPAPAPAPQPVPQPAPAPQPVPQPVPVQQMPVMQQPVMMQQPMVQDVNVAQAQFQPFAAMQSPLLQTENIDLLLDVPLEVTVELGKTSKSIKEILDFAPGTVVELNRLAGEPIDVLVNGKYVAKGEVVVMGEAFGIRITDVIK
ncbi:MAG: flagellar motor switch phosphatase FliY [Lachnospiraceae bacterium]|nr:flagellar motor switch phosphatase FliY [Lachnospiraceae bacterium]